MLDRSVRGSLRDGSQFGGRGILPLGHTVNLVVEEHQIDVDVPADGVDEMVTADSQRVTVAAHLPDAEIRIGDLHSGRDRGGAAVDAVEPVGVHIVRKP